MFFNTNGSKKLLLFFLKSFFLIVGFNIFLTSFFMILKGDNKKNSFQSEINLIIKDLKYDKSFKIHKDIY